LSTVRTTRRCQNRSPASIASIRRASRAVRSGLRVRSGLVLRVAAWATGTCRSVSHHKATTSGSSCSTC
jgi:hypothetical protein